MCLPEGAKVTVDEKEGSDMVSNANRTRIRIEVSNYGPIAEAGIDLRPLTVFVGPSNTGKSYLAILTYALHRFFSGASSTTEIGVSTPPRASSLLLPFGGFNANEGNREQDLEVLLEWIQQLRSRQESNQYSVGLPDEVASPCSQTTSPSPTLERNSTW